MLIALMTLANVMISSANAGTDQCVADHPSGYPKVNVYFDTSKEKFTGMERIDARRGKITYPRIDSKMLPYSEPHVANFTGYFEAKGNLLEVGVLVLHIFSKEKGKASGSFTWVSDNKVSIVNVNCAHES